MIKISKISDLKQENLNKKKLEELQGLETDLKKGYEKLLIKPRIGMYLRSLGFKFKWLDDQEVFLIPVRLEAGEGEEKKEHKHLILIQLKGLWVSIRVGLLPAKQIPEGSLETLKEMLLKANFQNPEFAFSMNEKSNVGFSQDIFIPALNFDVFMEELLSIPRAIEKFWTDIVPKLKEVQEDEEIEFFYT